MGKLKDLEMSITKSKNKRSKCKLCGYHTEEMYIVRRHGVSIYLCREHTEHLLLVAALIE